MNILLLVNKPMASESSHFYLHRLPEDIQVLVIPKLSRVKQIREYVEEYVSEDTDIVMSSVSSVTKALTGKSAVQSYGYVLDSKYSYKVVAIPSFEQRFYAPDKINESADRCKQALLSWLRGEYTEPGKDIIKYAKYLLDNDLKSITYALEDLHQYKVITCDTETYSLKHINASLGSIAFAWNKHEGIAIHVNNDPDIKYLLTNFFANYKGKIIWHNISYDIYILIYVLYMKGLLDQEGLLYGLEVMLSNWDDTQLITYLATNSCSGNELSLKKQAQEFAGDYAVEDIKDITKIPVAELLKYNLIDALSTWFVYEKHWNTLVKDDQLDIYNNIFKPAVKDVIQMQLTGAPIDIDRVHEVAKELDAIQQGLLTSIQSNPIVKELTLEINRQWVINKNNTLKVKRVTLNDAKEEFNPNSDKQLGLLINLLNLDVSERTETGEIATGKDVLESYKNQVKDVEAQRLLQNICDYKDVQKIVSTFIPPLKNSVLAEDGWHYLYGNFRLGGTISGRLSSNSPNLQQIPSKSTYGKLIKSCFKAPKGKIFVSLDFNALEAKIGALTTRDPNKLAIYLDGYDSHCFNAYTYWGDRMPDIRTGEPNDKFYKAVVNKEVIYFKGTDTITFKGKTFTGREFYKFFTS